MNELFEILSNLRSLRKEAKEMSLSELKDGLEKFQRVVQEVEEKQSELLAVNSEKQEKINFYRELLKDEGISVEELVTQLGQQSKPPRAKRKPLAPKYEYTDHNGELKTWTGQGRTPSLIQEALDNNTKSLSEFLIK
jgi:DNA-binding protein H-NS